MDKNHCSLGIDIGGTNTVFGLISSSGSIIKKDSLITDSEKGPVLLFDRIFEELKIWDQELNNQWKLKNIGGWSSKRQLLYWHGCRSTKFRKELE